MDQILKNIGKVCEPVAKEAIKGIGQHFNKHGDKYIKAGKGALLVLVGYLYGKYKYFIKGKKAGIAEQAKRDEEKFHSQARAHEQDRKKWDDTRKRYEDLLDDIEQN